MASGDQIGPNSFKLLDGLAAQDDGVWVDARAFQTQSIQVTGITTATIKICGSNAQTKPANNTHGAQIGSDITADSIVSVLHPVKWIKARISAHTTGTISAFQYGFVR